MTEYDYSIFPRFCYYFEASNFQRRPSKSGTPKNAVILLSGVFKLKLSQRLMIGKVIVSVVWLLIVASVIESSQVPFPSVFQGIGVFLVVSHIIEIIVFKQRMRGPRDYLLTMLFGALQLRTIRAKASNSAG